MVGTQAKATLLATVEAEREHWRRLVAEVGPDRLELPGAMGEWAFKDLAAHLTGWRDRTTARLAAAARGQNEPPPPWPAELTEDDAINGWIRDQNADKSPEEVLAEADLSYDRLAAALAALSDEDIATPGRFAWMEGGSIASADLFGHLHEEHEPEVRRWLADGATGR